MAQPKRKVVEEVKEAPVQNSSGYYLGPQKNGETAKPQKGQVISNEHVYHNATLEGKANEVYEVGFCMGRASVDDLETTVERTEIGRGAREGWEEEHAHIEKLEEGRGVGYRDVLLECLFEIIDVKALLCVGFHDYYLVDI